MDAQAGGDRRVVVVTGASSGFGKGVARAFAGQGDAVVVAARREELLEKLAAECNALGGEAIEVPTDVSRRQDVEALAEEAVRTFGRIDVWINNAGVGAIGRFDRIPLEVHTQVIETNLLGTLYGTWVAYRHFLSRGRGIVINIASELAEHTVPYYSSYSAAKHGIVGLDDSIRQELEKNGAEHVHVCTVLPSAHDTPFFDHAANYSGHEVRPPKPLHDPEDVIRTVIEIAADPRDRTMVGADTPFKILLKRLAPGLSSKLDANMMHKTQMEKAPPGDSTPGAVSAPISRGSEVDGGRRES